MLNALKEQNSKLDIEKGYSVFTVMYDDYESSFSVKTKELTETIFNFYINRAVSSLLERFKTFKSKPTIIASFNKKMYCVAYVDIDQKGKPIKIK